MFRLCEWLVCPVFVDVLVLAWLFFWLGRGLHLVSKLWHVELSEVFAVAARNSCEVGVVFVVFLL